MYDITVLQFLFLFLEKWKKKHIFKILFLLFSPPKSPVRRTLSEPPEGQADYVVIDFKARRSIKNQKSVVEQ